jgi:hypothetical protein
LQVFEQPIEYDNDTLKHLAWQTGLAFAHIREESYRWSSDDTYKAAKSWSEWWLRHSLWHSK